MFHVEVFRLVQVRKVRSFGCPLVIPDAGGYDNNNNNSNCIEWITNSSKHKNKLKSRKCKHKICPKQAILAPFKGTNKNQTAKLSICIRGASILYCQLARFCIFICFWNCVCVCDCAPSAQIVATRWKFSSLLFLVWELCAHCFNNRITAMACSQIEWMLTEHSLLVVPISIVSSLYICCVLYFHWMSFSYFFTIFFFARFFCAL